MPSLATRIAYQNEMFENLEAIAEDASTAAAGAAPAVHTHTIGNVTGLQAALDGKQVSGSYASATHTHVIADTTGLQTALDAKAPLASPTFTGTVGGITAAMVGLGSAENKSSATIRGEITSDNVTTALGYTPTSVTGLTGTQSVAAFKTGLTLVKGDVGLGSVDNTADTAKPVSTAQQTALNLKADLASPVFTGNPTAPTPSAGDNDTSIATTAYAMAAAPNASYRTLMDCSGSHIAGRVAGKYWLGQGDPIGVTGTGTLYPPNLLYIDSADYPTVNGLAPKLRLRAQVYVNDVAPTGNFTFGLYPVTRPGTSGGAGLNIYTMGTVVNGSTVAVNTPAADSANVLVGSDFALPANGHYVIGVVTTATVATSSHLHMSAILQLRNA